VSAVLNNSVSILQLCCAWPIFKEDMTPIASKARANIPEQTYGGNVQIFCMLPKAKHKNDERDETIPLTTTDNYRKTIKSIINKEQ